MGRKLFLISFFLCSCTVGPDFKRQNIYEDQKIASNLELTGKENTIRPNWYEMFQDKTLDNLISKALSNSPTILSGIEKLKQARLMMKINQASYMPMFNFESGYDYENVSKNIGLAADTDYFKAGFDASWEIDIWGKGRRLNEQNVAEFKGAYNQLQNMKASLTAEVANMYFLMRTAEEKKRIAQNNLALQGDIFKNIKDKYQAGLTDETAYRQSLYLLEKTKSSIPVLDSQIKAYSHALDVLTGTLPANKNDMPTKSRLFQKVFAYDTKQLFDLPLSIIRTRPDVQAAEQKLVAQNAAVGQAVAELYPDVSVSVLIGWAAKNGTDLFNGKSKTSGVSPSLIAPIFHFGQLQNQIKLEESKYREAYENCLETLLNAISELSNAMIKVQNSYKSARHQQSAVDHMRNALKSMRQKYENGLIEYSDLLASQQDLLGAETDLAQNFGNIYTALIAFYKATGGGYNISEK